MRAWLQGVIDGWNSPIELTSGMTYRSNLANELYDRGANLGQWLIRKKLGLPQDEN